VTEFKEGKSILPNIRSQKTCHIYTYIYCYGMVCLVHPSNYYYYIPLVPLREVMYYWKKFKKNKQTCLRCLCFIVLSIGIFFVNRNTMNYEIESMFGKFDLKLWSGMRNLWGRHLKWVYVEKPKLIKQVSLAAWNCGTLKEKMNQNWVWKSEGGHNCMCKRKTMSG